MTSTAQSRLERLLPLRAKLDRIPPDGLHFFEREILDYPQRQVAPTTLKDNINNSNADGLLSDSWTTKLQPPSQSEAQTLGAKASNGDQRADVPHTHPGQVISLPTAIRQRGLAATMLAHGKAFESDQGPPSSSRELVGQYCLWALVSKFCYKYMQDPESRVSQQFFASEKIFERNWHVYYLFGPESCAYKPLILVPTAETRRLLEDISSKFAVHLQFPTYPFQLHFYNDGTPAPQLLGTVNSKSNMQCLLAKIPGVPISYGQIPNNSSEVQRRDHAAWREKVERAFTAEKKKNASTKKRREKRDLTTMDNIDQLKRAQQYLGMREKPPAVQVVRQSETDPMAVSLGSGIKPAVSLAKPLDVSKPAPFPFEDQTVIIAIDVESYELDHSIITEIGVSTLDTANLLQEPPGHQGQNWIQKIRSRHFRIKGREQLQNVEYCHGNPDRFQFGTSEFVAIAEAADAVDSCFDWPYSAGFECAGPPDTDEQGFPIPREPVSLDTCTPPDDFAEPRNLLLVGHDINGDIAYLSHLGSSIFGPGPPNAAPQLVAARKRKVLSCIRECLDTLILHKALNNDHQGKSLMKLCHELDITPWYAHNAGNDARYTLEAFIKLVIKARQKDDRLQGAASNDGK